MTIYKNQSPWGSPPGSGGGSGNGGGFRRGPTPPNLDEAIKKLQDTINKFTGGGAGGKKPIILGLIILVVIWALSGLYRVLPDEQGVVLRAKAKFVAKVDFPTPPFALDIAIVNLVPGIGFLLKVFGSVFAFIVSLRPTFLSFIKIYLPCF